MIRTHRAATLLVPALLVAACTADPVTIHPEVEDSYGFETGLSGWTVVTAAGTEGTVTVTASSDMASTGSGSVALSFDDASGSGVAVLTRSFQVEPDQAYDVELLFDLATADGPGVQPWTIRAGAGAAAPDGAAGLVSVGSTQSDDTLLDFEARAVSVQGTSGTDGTFWVSVGVSQDTGGSRVYFVDDLEVSLTRR